MNITKKDFKRMVKSIYVILSEGRVYRGENEPQHQISTEYELTPDEINSLKGMNRKERTNFALKKLKQARRSKGQCISGGPNCDPPPAGPDGKPGPYCKKHLELFRAARKRLTQKRGSCARCPNPPLPGKKLCQKCTDELQSRREKALQQGLCIRCQKNPAEPGLQICRTCANAKCDIEKVRRITNPEAEKERIKKRDAEYRKKHAGHAKSYQQQKREKDRAAKIGWEIEETK